MTNADNIEKAFEQLNIKSTPALRQRILSDATQAMEQTIRVPAPKPDAWRLIMKAKTTQFAAAAAIIAALTIVYQLTGSIDGADVAWADVQRDLQVFRPYSCKQTIRYENGKVAVVRMFYRDLYGRREVLEEGQIRIWDFSKAPVVWLVMNPDQKQAWKTIFTDGQRMRDFDLLSTIARIEAGNPQPLGEKLVGNQNVVGFHHPDPSNEFTVWVEKMTHLPVRVELVQKSRTITMTDFQFPDTFDDSLFTTDPPADYALEIIERKMNTQSQTIQPFDRPYTYTEICRQPGQLEVKTRVQRKDLTCRREIRADGQILIFDMSTRPVKILRLDTTGYNAYMQTFKDRGPMRDPDIIALALGLKNGSENPLSPRVIDGKECSGYKGTLGMDEHWSVWIDPNSGLPALIEADQKVRTLIFSHFDYAAPLEDSLFEMTVPPGYRLIEE